MPPSSPLFLWVAFHVGTLGSDPNEPFSLRGGNRSSCPTADLQVGRARRNSVLHRYAPIAKHDVTRLKCLGLEEIKSQADRQISDQWLPTSEDHGAHSELIFVDQFMLRKLRHDRAAPKDDEVFARLFLHRLDLARIELTQEAGIFPREAIHSSREHQFSHRRSRRSLFYRVPEIVARD